MPLSNSFSMLPARQSKYLAPGRRRQRKETRLRLGFALDLAGEGEVLNVAVEQQCRAAGAVAVLDEERDGRCRRHPLHRRGADVACARRRELTDSLRARAASSKSQLHLPSSPAFHTSLPVRQVIALMPCWGLSLACASGLCAVPSSPGALPGRGSRTPRSAHRRRPASPRSALPSGNSNSGRRQVTGRLDPAISGNFNSSAQPTIFLALVPASTTGACR